MKFFAVGFDFKTAAIDLRAKAFAKNQNMLNVVSPESLEKVVLSTCNRSEIYGIANGDDEPQCVIDRWAAECKLSGDELQVFKIYRDRETLAHLFRVVSGMESMVVGETQIAGQVKRSYEEGIRAGTVGPHFHRIFQKAFKVAKRIRAQTEVGKLAVSIPSIGVKLAEKILGDLSQKNVGIIGLGEIGRVAAEYFGSVQPKNLFLYNRTQSVAEELHDRFQNEGVRSSVVSSLEEILSQSEVIVSAVDTLLVKASDLQKLDARGISSFVLDLSVPPSVESTSLQNAFLFGIDDLKKIAEENTLLREQEVKKAESIIEEEAERCWQGLQLGAVSQTFEKLAKKVETLTIDELRSLRSRLPQISERDWAEVEKMAYRLTSKVVQDPMMELKTQIQTNGESESLIQFFRNIFRI